MIRNGRILLCGRSQRCGLRKIPGQLGAAQRGTDRQISAGHALVRQRRGHPLSRSAEAVGGGVLLQPGRRWGKEVSISTKKAAYAPAGDNLHTIGSIIDFEKIGSRSPAGIRPGSWQVDDPIGSTWGYTTRHVRSPTPARSSAGLSTSPARTAICCSTSRRWRMARFRRRSRPRCWA